MNTVVNNFFINFSGAKWGKVFYFYTFTSKYVYC